MLIGFVLYPEVTALDVVGPFEVLARLPESSVRFVGARRGPVQAQHGLSLHVDTPYEECPQLDVLCVPGGPGQMACMEDAPLLRFLGAQAVGARWITSVCTGSLILGAAGLLQGYRATTHWRYMECLRDLGAVPVHKRVVADRNRLTGAGVSAGLDLGLFLSALLAGEQAAQTIQLQLEYDPQPPFHAGAPERADVELVTAVQERTAQLHDRRREQTRQIGAALNEPRISAR